jgi:hypothetical protein
MIQLTLLMVLGGLLQNLNWVGLPHNASFHSVSRRTTSASLSHVTHLKGYG